MSERGIISWQTLRATLLEEFQVTVSSAQIHKKLMERSLRKEESIQEFFFLT